MQVQSSFRHQVMTLTAMRFSAASLFDSSLSAALRLLSQHAFSRFLLHDVHKARARTCQGLRQRQMAWHCGQKAVARHEPAVPIRRGAKCGLASLARSASGTVECQRSQQFRSDRGQQRLKASATAILQRDNGNAVKLENKLRGK